MLISKEGLFLLVSKGGLILLVSTGREETYADLTFKTLSYSVSIYKSNSDILFLSSIRGGTNRHPLIGISVNLTFYFVFYGTQKTYQVYKM